MTVPSNTHTDKPIAAALRELRSRFKTAGLDSPEIDARILLMEATGLSRSDIIAYGQTVMSKDALEKLEALAGRRLSGEPVDSILGHVEFYGRRFKISRNVLSPRPETEELVSRALDLLKSADSPRVLDLGTGSGAILISVLAERCEAMGTGADKSATALRIARENSDAHKVTSRAQWVESDWYDNIYGLFDLIVSNPPYITDAAMHDLSPEVANFDPDLALRGGADGLSAYGNILAGAMDFLKPGGGIILEIGYDQGQSVHAMMKAAGFSEVTLHQDLSGHDRIVQGNRPIK